MRTCALSLLLVAACSGGSGIPPFDAGVIVEPDGGPRADAPVLTALTPAALLAGSPQTKVTLTGRGFSPGVLVLVGSDVKETARVDETTLELTLTGAELAAPQRLDVRALNPPPGGGLSNALELTIARAQPAPTLDRLEPERAREGAAMLTLTVHGSNFSPTAVVQWNGATRPTVWKSSVLLEAAVTSSDLMSAGPVMVTVLTPPPGGGSSAPRTFTIEPVAAAVTLSIGIASDGGPVRARIDSYALSPEGRWAAFATYSDQVVPNDTNLSSDVFLRDTCVGAPEGCVPWTERISLDPDGGELPSNSTPIAISRGARWVLLSAARGAVITRETLVIRDTCLGAPAACVPSNIPVVVAADGGIRESGARLATLTPDGRFVAFAYDRNDLLPEDTDGRPDIIVRDTCLGAPTGCEPSNELVSFAPDGGEFSTVSSYDFHMSDDGRFVTFVASAQSWLRDTCRGATSCTPSTVLVSVGDAGQTTLPSQTFEAAISGDGRYVVFCTGAPLGLPDFNGANDVFLRDTCHGATSCGPWTLLVSQRPDGRSGNGESRLGGSSWSTSSVMSTTGRYIAFTSGASDLVMGDPFSIDVFVRDTCLGAPASCTPRTRVVSRSLDGGLPSGDSHAPKLSADGRWVLFTSTASNLVPDDTNNATDVFLAPSGF